MRFLKSSSLNIQNVSFPSRRKQKHHGSHVRSQHTRKKSFSVSSFYCLLLDRRGHRGRSTVCTGGSFPLRPEPVRLHTDCIPAAGLRFRAVPTYVIKPALNMCFSLHVRIVLPRNVDDTFIKTC